MYAALDNTEPADTMSDCESGSIMIPDGWKFAPNDPDVVTNVIATHAWGTDCVVMADGSSWSTSIFSMPGTDCWFDKSSPVVAQNANKSWTVTSCNRRILIVKPAAPAGPGFAIGSASAPSAGYALASILDLKNFDFYSAMSGGPGLPYVGDAMLGCCIFKVHEGYVVVDDTYVAPYQNGEHSCAQSYTGLVELGGAMEDGKSHNGEAFVSPINATAILKLSTVPDFASSDLGCDAGENTLAFFKTSSKTSAPTTTVPAGSLVEQRESRNSNNRAAPH